MGDSYRPPRNAHAVQTAPKMVGYWDAPWWSRLNLPRPDRLIRVGWRFSDRENIVAYLRSGVSCNVFMGSASCRLCRQYLGSLDLTDGEWVWPERLEHYVSEHEVMLPDEFVDSMRAHLWLVPSHAKIVAEYQYDDFSFWREWAGQQLKS